MTKFNSHSITAAIGALLISTVFIGAAIGPAHAVQAGPVTAQAQISAQASA